MQATYPKKLPATNWDTLNVEYPVHQFLHTGTSSETIARQWRDQPEVITDIRRPIYEEVEYDRDYNVTRELTRSQSAIDHDYKPSDRFRFNKHTAWSDNQYIYPPSKKLSDRVPECTAHLTTEMRSSYEVPTIPSRLVTDKDQYKHPVNLPLLPIRETEILEGSHCGLTPDARLLHFLHNNNSVTPVFWFEGCCRGEPQISTDCKELEPLDTTYEGFEKYLDPYLTTNKLHHRPYTSHELTKISNSKDIMTYYTYADIPWVRVPRPKVNEWGIPLSRPKSMYDREKFKEDFREIRTHNKLRWVPGTFRTESRDNYMKPTSHPTSKIHNHEEEVRTAYQRVIGQLSTNVQQEDITTLQNYCTEYSVVASRKPTCAVFDPFVKKNKRLTGNS